MPRLAVPGREMFSGTQAPGPPRSEVGQMTRQPSNQTHPSQEEKILMALVKAAEIFKRSSAAIFKRESLSFSQYNVLRVLEASPGGSGNLTEVSRALLASAPNLSGVSKRLEKNGFITRRVASRDERVKLLTITAKGRRVLKLIAGRQEANVQRYFMDCPLENKKALFDFLRNMLKLE